ncbi:MAG: DUF2846 domain-containing protein [Gammaproteobacteria bacterium]|nr:DUF2846 domain-containing protein [Gammaproteobacteria bacterium]HQT05420.1 DUF2846 domain-containing protein [Thiotrichales bacterium]
MKKLLLSYLLLAVLVLTGCATVPMASPEADQKAKAFATPSSDMASLYIFRDSQLGAALKKMVKIDGQNIGETAPNTYFHIFAKPGKRTLSTESEFSDNSLEVSLEPGKVHYVRNYMKMGLFIGGANLEIVDGSEAKQAIHESCKLAQPVSDKSIY